MNAPIRLVTCLLFLLLSTAINLWPTTAFLPMSLTPKATTQIDVSSAAFGERKNAKNVTMAKSREMVIKAETPSKVLFATAPCLPFLSTLQPHFSTLLSSTGPIPIIYSLSLNIILFTSLQPKLLTMLTVGGYIHSIILGSGLWYAFGWRGWSLCVCYLFLGQLVTKVRFEEKEKKGIAEGRGGRRGPENVWGSAATALFCALCHAHHDSLNPLIKSSIPRHLFMLGYISSLSTKLSDTFASEIGKAYGKTTFLITSWGKRVPPGTEGAISLEGTLASMLGGVLLPFIGWLGLGLIGGAKSVGLVTVAAFLATLWESWLGAAVQGKEGYGWMTNEVVNFFNTLLGALIGMGLGHFLLI